MSATSQPTTFLDIQTDIANRVSADTNITDTLTQAKRYANIALFDMHIGSGERFTWAERDAILTTHPVYSFAGGSTVGGISISKGGTAALFLVGAVSLGIRNNNDIGQRNMNPGGTLVVGGTTEPYRVTSVYEIAGFDFANIESKYIGETTGAEKAFTYFEDEYDLASDFLRPVDLQRFGSGALSVPLIGRIKFRERYPKVITTGRPTVATIVDRAVGTLSVTSVAGDGATTDALPRRRIRFWPAPGSVERINYSYITSDLAVSATGTPQVQMVEDTDKPIVPLGYRMLIVYHALYSWYRDRKDDIQRATLAKAQYDELLARVRSDTEVGQSRPQFRPAVGSYRRKARSPWSGGRGGRGRFDDGRFDSMEDV